MWVDFVPTFRDAISVPFSKVKQFRKITYTRIEYRFLDSLKLEDGTDSVSKRQQTTTKISYITPQKSEDLIYTAVEA